MYLLSLETSTKSFSLAVSKDEKILRFRNMRTAKILESSIITAIDRLLKSCHLDLQKIDTFAIGLGPGSFTSLRVGLSTVKGFTLALNKNIVGIGGLDMIAQGVGKIQADQICVIVDARRGKIYTAIYDKAMVQKTEYLLTTVEDILKKLKGTTLFVGDGLSLYKGVIEKTYQGQSIFAPEKFWYPKAQVLAKLGFKKAKQKQYDDPAKIVPVYLYPQDCQVDKR